MAMDGTDGSVFGSAKGPAGISASFRPRATRIPRAGVGKISRWEQARSVGPLVFWALPPGVSRRATRRERATRTRAREPPAIETKGGCVRWGRFAGTITHVRSLGGRILRRVELVRLRVARGGGGERQRVSVKKMLGNDGAAGAVERAARTRAPRTRSGRPPGRGMNPRRGATGGSAGVARTRGGTRARRFARAQPPATRVGESRRGFFHPGLVATGGRAHLWKEAVEAVEQIGVSPQEFFNPADHLRGVAPARGAGRGAFSGGCLSAESSGEKRHCGAPFGSSLATHLAFLKSLMTSRKASWTSGLVA